MARILCVAAFAILPSAASLAQPAPDSGAASRWRVARLAATQVKTAAPIAAFHVVDGRPPVRVTGQPPPRLGPGDIVVESTASAAARVPSDPGTSWVLPVRIRIQDRRGQEVSLVPWLTVQGGGLRWNAAAGVFRGTIAKR